ncbi:SET domain containing hypothetical protein, partial [Phytophthora palmivora]
QTECVRGRFITEKKCGNQLMQDSVHASRVLMNVDCKGIGLTADKTIKINELVAKYVGEVLRSKMYQDREIMEGRMSDNIYGIQVTATEAIDACYIGGIACFANHSCDPNCDVQRW